ncbi:MAG: DUF4214 domain-containing protein [Pseudomonadota bacterium]
MSLSPTFVQQMYVAYFGRPADPGGLVYFAQLDENALIQTFSASAESQALFNGATGSAAINAIYQNLFNRDAEAAGLAYWSGLVSRGQISAVGAALSILRGATNDDLTAVTNKVAVAALFTSHVDTTAEIIGYAGDGAAAVARTFLKAVGSSTDSVTTAQNNVDQAVLSALVPVAAQTFVLTANADTVTGGAGNDTITASAAGYFGSGDNIDGGAGSDTLSVSGETADITGSGITVTNVETASLTTSGAINLDTTSWTGLTSLAAAGNGTYVLKTAAGTNTTANAGAVADKQVVVDGGAAVTVNASGITTGSITVGSNAAPAGAIVVNASESSNAAMGNIFVQGGTSVTVNQTAANAVNTTSTNPAIDIQGTAATTAVVLNAAARATASASVAGVATSTMNVTDVNAGSTTLAGTITSVTAGNFSTLNIADNALSTMTVNGSTGTLNISNGGLTVPAATTLNLNLNSVLTTLQDAGVYTTLNVAVSGNLVGINNFSTSALKTLNVGGTGQFFYVDLGAIGALQTVKATGAAGVGGTFSANNGLTLIDTSGTTGGSSLTYDPSKTTFVGGAGNENLNLSSATLISAINLGDGDDAITLASGTTAPAFAISGGNGTDRLTMLATDAAAVTTAGTNAFSSKVIGFEKLVLSGPSGTQVVDLALLGGNFTRVDLSPAFYDTSANLTLNHFAAGATLGLFNPVTSVTVNGDFSGTNDTLNLQLGATDTTNFTSTGLTAVGIENININASNGNPSPAANATESLILLGNDAKTITATGTVTQNNVAIGSVTLALTAASTALTSVDASGMATGSLTWTSGVLANAAVVKGSAQGNDVISLAADANAVTFTGGTGNVSITTGAGNDTLSVGGGANTVNVGSGTDRVNITAVNAASSTVFTTITGLSTGGGDTVSLGGSVNAMGSRVTDLNTTLLADLNAAAAGSASSAAPVLHWFTFGGDTYIVKDVSAGSAFTVGADMVVKLAGVLDLSAVTVAGGVITL